MASKKALKVLICSANIGNEEPTPESFASWVPYDGHVDEINAIKKLSSLSGKKGPLNGRRLKTRFDFIVLGMQEATFSLKLEKNSNQEHPAKKEKVNYIQINYKHDHDEKSKNQEDKYDRKSDKFSDHEEKYDGKSDKLSGSIGESEHNQSSSIFDFELPSMKLTFANRDDSAKLSVIHHPEVEKSERVWKYDHNALRSKIDRTSNATRKTLKGLTASDDYTRKKSTEYDTMLLNKLISTQCPSYTPVVNFLRGQMRLMVLVKNDLIDQLKDVNCKAVNTGVGKVLANKGGIVASVTLNNTRLAFITAHLEAHEGKSHYLGRCANLATILGGAKIGTVLQDVSISHHHCFICGDLNFRVKFKDPDYNKEEHVMTAVDLVKNHRWQWLTYFDELKQAINYGDCLVGFKTPPCDFPPTFKVKRQKGLAYNPQRTPSYTDRILWKSAHNMEDNVEIIAYESCLDFATSDHKPIRGAFTINMGDHNTNPRASLRESTRSATVFFYISNISISKLKFAQPVTIKSPFIIFATDPRDIINTNTSENIFLRLFKTGKKIVNPYEQFPRTSIKWGEDSPTWEKTIELTLLEPTGKGGFSYEMLYIMVMNLELGVEKLIGTVALNLKGIKNTYEDASNETLVYNEPILKNGKSYGSLNCQIDVSYMRNEEVSGERRYSSIIESVRNIFQKTKSEKNVNNDISAKIRESEQ